MFFAQGYKLRQICAIYSMFPYFGDFFFLVSYCFCLFFLKIISKNFTGISSPVRNVDDEMSYGNLSRLYTILCSRKVTRSKATCEVKEDNFFF